MKSEIHSLSGYITTAVDPSLPYDRNNCVPKALTALTGEPYKGVDDYLKARGRKKGKGTPRRASVAFLQERGFEQLAPPTLLRRYHGGKFRSMKVASFAKAFPKGKFIVYVRGHAVAVIDGRILDDWNSSSRVVKEAWQIK